MKQSYSDYLKSWWWKDYFSPKARKHYGFKCYVCGAYAYQTHHLYYYKNGKSILNCEKYEDVRLLCVRHHYKGQMNLDQLDDIKRMEQWRKVIEFPIQLVQTSVQRMLRKR